MDASAAELFDRALVPLVDLAARVEQRSVEVSDEQLEAGQLAALAR